MRMSVDTPNAGQTLQKRLPVLRHDGIPPEFIMNRCANLALPCHVPCAPVVVPLRIMRFECISDSGCIRPCLPRIKRVHIMSSGLTAVPNAPTQASQKICHDDWQPARLRLNNRNAETLGHSGTEEHVCAVIEHSQMFSRQAKPILIHVRNDNLAADVQVGAQRM